MNDICPVKVPHFIELSASRVYRMAMNKAEIAIYLPDFCQEKPLNRTYLFNVSSTFELKQQFHCRL